MALIRTVNGRRIEVSWGMFGNIEFKAVDIGTGVSATGKSSREAIDKLKEKI